MKKKIAIIAGTVLILFVLYFFGFGFGKAGSVYIDSYSVSPDGSEMTIHTAVSSSAGYVRKISAREQGGKLYLDCYSAFGGVNGSVGAKSEYTISLDESVDTICIWRDINCYEEVMKKDGSGDWQRVS